MWQPMGETSYLEDVFSILRFRRRGVVSFRRFVILSLRDGLAHALRDGEGTTQPLRVML